MAAQLPFGGCSRRVEPRGGHVSIGTACIHKPSACHSKLTSSIRRAFALAGSHAPRAPHGLPILI
eukprot:7475571-Pyramimonas_sp.AAC.1